MKINKLLTRVNYKNTNDLKRIKYIVIHYVGATGGAQDNCKYFYSNYRGVSAHYFVGHKGEVWQCVDDADVAWHCGADTTYKHKECRNSNSIGIEMCCKLDNKGKWYFKAKTVTTTIKLVKELMAKYNIPAKNVIRHYDVTGKRCPEPFVSNEAAWLDFKAELEPKVAAPSFKAYRVKVDVDGLNVRAGAGTQYKIKSVIKDRGVYTIVKEKNGWGKLKSGAGWIILRYTKKI